MKASDYIVEWLICQGVKDVFGYPGGMVTHFMDSIRKRRDCISSHLLYHEQAAAFAACGYSQATGTLGVAYATSGPGATNLITGICNAFFDSIPVLFITGQVNTFESSDGMGIRQRGFQETDVVSMVKDVTKFSCKVPSADDLPAALDAAYRAALAGRPGPVLLDIPMDVFRANVRRSPEKVELYQSASQHRLLSKEDSLLLRSVLDESERPVLLFGNGIRMANAASMARSLAEKVDIPIVSSMLGMDIAAANDNYFGFVGAYGDRAANFVVAKSDLIIAIGSRMDIRQVGSVRKNFAPDARVLRFDVDESELEYKLHDDDICFALDAKDALCHVMEAIEAADYARPIWSETCREIRRLLPQRDPRLENDLVAELGENIPEGAVIVADVGQNQLWVAQELVKGTQRRALFSGGHGAMGYSLPAAIGACIALEQPVYSFSGDGGFQMNIQELQTVKRENLPVKMIVLNNKALGMIRHFQEMYFDGEYTQTVSEEYTVPSFSDIAKSYGIAAEKLIPADGVPIPMLSGPGPFLLECIIDRETYVFPKLEFGMPNQDQEPRLDRELYEHIMSL